MIERYNYFVYKNQPLIDSFYAQLEGGNLQQETREVTDSESVDASFGASIKILKGDINTTTGASNKTVHSFNPGDHKISYLLHRMKKDLPSLDTDISQIVMIKGQAKCIHVAKFMLPIHQFYTSENSDSEMLNIETLKDLLELYYPDPIIQITTETNDRYIMPANMSYFESCQQINLYGFELPGQYSAVAICAPKKDPASETISPVMMKITKNLDIIDNIVLQETGIDLKGLYLIPIAIFQDVEISIEN